MPIKNTLAVSLPSQGEGKCSFLKRLNRSKLKFLAFCKLSHKVISAVIVVCSLCYLYHGIWPHYEH